MKLARAAQKPNGIWYIDFLGADDKRHRISTGIKSEPRRTPPPEVKVQLQIIVRDAWGAGGQND